MNKRLFLLMALSVFLSTSPVLAASGSATASYTQAFKNSSTNYDKPDVIISNVSDTDATVKVTFYKSDGSAANDGSDNISGGDIQAEISTVTDWDETLTGSESVSFTLGAGDTQDVFYQPSSEWGYVRIEWEQSSSHNSTALIATIKHLRNFNDGEKSYYIQAINAGLPF